MSGTRESRMRAAHRTADAYEALGFPDTKECRNPDCPYPNPQPINKFSTKTRRWTDGRVVTYPTSWCKRCANKRKKERRDRLKAEDPKALRAREKKYRKRYIANDPEAHKEYQRIWANGKSRANGVPERKWEYREATDGVKDKRLPLTDEFCTWLGSLVLSKLEKDLYLSRGYLVKYAHGACATISLGFADRILMQVNDGHALTDFWPDV